MIKKYKSASERHVLHLFKAYIYLYKNYISIKGEVFEIKLHMKK